MPSYKDSDPLSDKLSYLRGSGQTSYLGGMETSPAVWKERKATGLPEKDIFQPVELPAD